MFFFFRSQLSVYIFFIDQIPNTFQSYAGRRLYCAVTAGHILYYVYSGLIGRSSCRYEGWKYYIISRQNSGSCRNYYIIIIANCDTYRYRYVQVKLNSRAKFTHYQSMYYTLLSTVYINDISMTLYYSMVLHCINWNNNSLT